MLSGISRRASCVVEGPGALFFRRDQHLAFALASRALEWAIEVLYLSEVTDGNGFVMIHVGNCDSQLPFLDPLEHTFPA